MRALLRRATHVATLSAALFVACTALPPAAHAYRASPGYGNEADLDRHDTYRNRDGETVHAPAHSKSGRVPDGASARCRDGTYSFSSTGAAPAPGMAASPRGCERGSAEWPARCQRQPAAKYNTRSHRRAPRGTLRTESPDAASPRAARPSQPLLTFTPKWPNTFSR